MLTLIAAGRDGSDPGPPVYFTVPWSPGIERRGQMPGNVWRSLMSLVEVLRRNSDAIRDFHELSDGMLIWSAIQTGRFTATEALGVMLARRTLVELAFFQSH